MSCSQPRVMPVPAPYEDTLEVKPDWLDANGHMNVAFYMHAFDDGGEIFFRDCGIGWEYTREGEGSIFMSNCDLDFRRELFRGDTIRVTTRLIDWRPKLVHTWQAIYHRDDGYLAATAEMLFVHIAFADRRSAPMPGATQARLAQVEQVHHALERPENLGRKIEIR